MPTKTNQRGVIPIDVPTSLRPAVYAASASIVAVGTAPVGSLPGFQWVQGGFASVVNRPILTEMASDFTEQLGESSNWKSYTLCEIYDAVYIEGNVSPYIPINVFDPWVHSTKVTSSTVTVDTAHLTVSIAAEVILPSLVVTGTGGVVYHDGVDFAFSYDDDTLQSATLNIYPTSPMAAETTVTLSYSVPDLSMITSADIIGGVDTQGNYSGLEVLEKVYSVTGIVPATVLTPGWGDQDDVIAAGNSRVQSINNGRFRAIFLPDVDTTAVRKYEDLWTHKNASNMVSAFETAGWPMLKLSNKLYHFSTILAYDMAWTDSNYGNIPYVSPSNKSVNIDGTVLADGTVVDIDLAQADAIENWGLMTAVNDDGWKLLGDYTCAYPDDTDVHDFWINERRMFNWLGNSLGLTLKQFIDLPGNVRTLASIGETIQQFGNHLVAVGASNTFRVRFLASENLAEQVMAGIYTYHILWTPPTPIRTLDLLLEYSVDDLTAWIAQVTIPGTN